MPGRVITRGFAAGELSPEFIGRTDVQGYDSALALAENWFVKSSGALLSRPGTKYVGELPVGPTRMFPYAPETRDGNFILVFTDRQLYFIQDGDLLYHPPETAALVFNPLRVAFTISQGVISTPQYAEYQGGSFLADSNTDKQGEFSFHTGDVTPTTANAININALQGGETYTLAISPTLRTSTRTGRVGDSIPYGTAATAALYGSGTSLFIFDGAHGYPTGTYVKFVLTENATLVGTGDAAYLYAAGVASVGGTLTDFDAITWFSVSRQLTLPSGIVRYPEGTLFRVTTNAPWLQGLVLKVARLEEVGNTRFIYPSRIDGIDLPRDSSPVQLSSAERIYSIDTPYTAAQLDDIIIQRSFETVKVTHPDHPVYVLTKSGPRDWTLQADPVSQFGGALVFNNPVVSTVFQQRQIYAGAPRDPFAVFGSAVGNFTDFDFESGEQGPTAASAYKLILDTNIGNPVRHILSSPRGLLIFTKNAIWLLTAQGYWEQIAVTALSNSAAVQTEIGVDRIQPIATGGVYFFVEDGGHSIQLLGLAGGQGSGLGLFTNRELSILVTDLVNEANPPIRWAYARKPHDLLYSVLKDGRLAVMTYSHGGGFGAFTHYVTAGLYKDVAVLQEGSYDRTYYLVERVIDGHTRLFLEREQIRLPHVDEDDTSLDCSVTQELAPASDMLHGVAYLLGQEVAIRASGSVMPSQVVEGGTVPLDTKVQKASAGLPFKCVARSLPPVVRDTVTEGSVWLPIRVSPRVLNTRGLKIGTRLNKLSAARERTTEQYGSPTDAYTGVRSLTLGGRTWEQESQLYMVQDEPLPAIVLNLVYELELGTDLE